MLLWIATADLGGPTYLRAGINHVKPMDKASETLYAMVVQ